MLVLRYGSRHLPQLHRWRVVHLQLVQPIHGLLVLRKPNGFRILLLGIDDVLLAFVIRKPLLLVERAWVKLVLPLHLRLELEPWLLVQQLVASQLVTTPAPWRPWIGPRHCSENRSGFVYLIGRVELNALKIGVTGEESDRLEQHYAHGWVLRDIWRFESLTDAFLIEELVLDRWRNLYRCIPWLSREQVPQGGWTETIEWTAATELELRRFIRNHWVSSEIDPDVSNERHPDY